MNLETISATPDSSVALRLRHLRGINSTNPPPAVLVEMAESAAEFFKGYVRALEHCERITHEQSAALVWEVLGELESVYLQYAPEKAAQAEGEA